MGEISYLLFVGCNGKLITGAPAYLKRAEDEGILVKGSTQREFHLRELTDAFDDQETKSKLKEIVRKQDILPNAAVVLRAEINHANLENMVPIAQLAADFCKRYDRTYFRIYKSSTTSSKS